MTPSPTTSTLAIDKRIKRIQANAEDAVLVGFNPTIPPQFGREPHLSFLDTTLETETSLGRSPVSFDVGGSSFVGAGVLENGSHIGVPNLKNRK